VRRAAYGIALWGCAVVGSVALIFEPTQALFASVFFIAFAVLVLRGRAGRPNVAPRLAVVLAALGLALGSVPFDPLRAVGDGVVTCAILIVIASLLRSVRADRPASQATWRLRRTATRIRGEAAFRALVARLDGPTWHRLWVGVAVAAIVLVAAVGAGTARGAAGWRLVGGPDGAAVWNAGVLDSALERDGPTLRDPLFVTANGNAPRVGIADSPALTAAKLTLPGAWRGPEIANLLALADLVALLICAVLFVAELTGTVGGAAVGVTVVLLLAPLLRQLGLTAPFDLWPALLVATVALRRPSPWMAVAAAPLGLLNVAGGYEAAVLALGLSLGGRLPARTGWAVGIAGVVGSLIGAIVSETVAPDVTTSSLWWSSNDLFRLTGASGIGWPWIGSALALLALIAAVFWSLSKRDSGALRAGGAAVVAGALAIPALAGGVPLLVPARLLDAIPLGWPTARILAVALVLLAVPVAAAIRLLGARAHEARGPTRALGLIALTLVAFALTWPPSAQVVVPAVPPGSTVIELPLAEPGSRASFVFADDLLTRGARVLQPIPYVRVATKLSSGDRTDAAIAAVRTLPRPAYVVLRVDIYADPAQRFVQPTVIDAADYAVPVLDRQPGATLWSLTDKARVYQLAP
jgi:hypothetical protein